MANFSDILNTPAESITKPKPLPPGTYLSIINGPHKQREVNDKPVIDITYKTAQAQADVDQTALADAGGIGRMISQTFFLTNNDGQESTWPLLNFLENHLGIEKAGKSLAQMLSEIPGKQVLVTVKHAVYTNKTTGEPDIAANVGGTAKV
jgi:hypothetical protein